jgi:membrane-associated protease RseP (regulator of RpoE activity)
VTVQAGGGAGAGPEPAPPGGEEHRRLGETLREDPWGVVDRRKRPDQDHSTPGTPRQQRWALVRLVGVVALIIGIGFAAGVGETVILVGALILCIVLHELGHFLTAKAGNIKVTEFFVGFGPRLWSVRHGETEYGVKALPLGGYCKIIGMHNLDREVDPADEPRTYRQAPVGRRLSVAFAGSAMHFLIAAVVLFAMFAGPGDTQGYYLQPPGDAPISQLYRLSTGPSPAQAAGLHPGDRIERVDGRPFATFAQMSAFIRARPGQPLALVVDRDGHRLALTATPADLSKVKVTGATAAASGGFLGVSVDPAVHPSLVSSVADAGGAWAHMAGQILHAFGNLVTFHGFSSYLHMLTNQKAATSPGADRFVSPVGIVPLFHQAGQQGIGTVLFLLADINLSLGIFNLVPLLPLDGGHVAIAVYEGVRSRLGRRRYHADVAKLIPLLYLAIVGIAFIALTSLYLDIRYPIS